MRFTAFDCYSVAIITDHSANFNDFAQIVKGTPGGVPFTMASGLAAFLHASEAIAAVDRAIGLGLKGNPSLAAASRAKRIGSESYRLWRDALEVLMRRDFGHGGEMKGDDVKRLIDCLKAANMMLFLDAAVADYVPLQQAGGEDGGEADDGI